MEHKRWAILWRSENKLDGVVEHFMWNDEVPLLFHTREDARKYVRREIGDIYKRKDLQREPYGWKPPKVIQVYVNLTPVRE